MPSPMPARLHEVGGSPPGSFTTVRTSVRLEHIEVTSDESASVAACAEREPGDVAAVGTVQTVDVEWRLVVRGGDSHAQAPLAGAADHHSLLTTNEVPKAGAALVILVPRALRLAQSAQPDDLLEFEWVERGRPLRDASSVVDDLLAPDRALGMSGGELWRRRYYLDRFLEGGMRARSRAATRTCRPIVSNVQPARPAWSFRSHSNCLCPSECPRVSKAPPWTLWLARTLPLFTALLAEEKGFEPLVELPPRRFSKPLP
jgi:hypothetical protein